MADSPLEILVIDDEALIRWAICRTLAEAGHRVVEGSDAASALALLRGGARPDVVLLDYRLPGAHGFDLLAGIRALTPHSAIVMMSADQSPDDVAEAVRQGVYAVMQKPFDMDGLPAVVERASLTRPGEPPEGSRP